MECLKIILLAIIQGVAEFLPISSSGHLAVLGTLFGFDPEENLAIGIVLHAGTLLAILIFYLKTLLKFFRKDHLWLAAMILLGSVPAGIFGVALKLTGAAENVFNSLWIAGGGFLITATLQLEQRANVILPILISLTVVFLYVYKAIQLLLILLLMVVDMQTLKFALAN